MQKYNTDLRQSLKWLQNEAPNIQAVIEKKALWFEMNNDKFWSDWEANIFDLRTCNSFGLMIWCIILGVPSNLFTLNPKTQLFAFGDKRENFVYSGTLPPPSGTNPSDGGNFSSQSTGLTSLSEIRTMLMLRYATLVSNGRISYMNRMLNWIFNGGKPWDIKQQNFAFAMDSEAIGTELTPTVFMFDWQGNRVVSLIHDRKNWFSNSEDLSSANVHSSNVTIVTDAESSPAATFDVGMIFPSTANAKHSFGMVTEPTEPLDTNQTQWTLSFFIKSLGQRNVSIEINGNQDGVFKQNLAYNKVDVVAGTFQGGGQMSGIEMSNGWFRFEVTVIVPPASGINGLSIECTFLNATGQDQFAGNPNDILLFWGWQCESEIRAGDYIRTTSIADMVLPKLQLNKTNGDITFARPPVNGAFLTWTGMWGLSSTVGAEKIADANGTSLTYRIPRPINTVPPITRKRYIEFRLGKSIKISDAFVALLNDRNNGLMPQNACVQYLVIKES